MLSSNYYVDGALTRFGARNQRRLVHYHHKRFSKTSFTGEKRGINSRKYLSRGPRVGDTNDTRTPLPPVPLPGLASSPSTGRRPFCNPTRSSDNVPSAACSKNLRRFVRPRILIPDASSNHFSVSSLLLGGSTSMNGEWESSPRQ